MRRYLPFAFQIALFLVCLYVACRPQQQSPASAADHPLKVNQTMVSDPKAYALFDGLTTTPYFPGWEVSLYPASFTVDFGKKTAITRIRYFDGTGQSRLIFKGVNSPADQSPVFTASRVLDLYQVWSEIKVTGEFRYLIVTLESPQGDAQVGELEVYVSGEGGSPVDTTIVIPPKDTTVVIPPRDTVRLARGEADKINLCGFHWVPLNKLKIFAAIRIYVATPWIWRPGGLYVEPMYQAGSPAVPGYDTYFAAAKAQGLEVIPCINQWREADSKSRDVATGWSPKNSIREGQRLARDGLSDDHPPIKAGADRLDPKSYDQYARFWFQFIARYGSVKHPPSALRVDTSPRWSGDIPNVIQTGLGLIHTVEVWNEPDKWWKRGGAEDAIYQGPQAYAAQLWAAYDAIKKADPSVKVVMAGITGFDLPYLEAMAAYYRSKGVPFKADVINVHHYSNVGNLPGKWPPTWLEGGAVCPEMDKDFGTISQIVAFAHSLGKPVWVTEFGSDSRAPSWMYAKPFSTFTSEQLQAQWLVRTYLEYLRFGVDNMFMFNAINEPGAVNGGLYLNSGLLYGQNESPAYGEKPAYKAVASLIQTLTGTTYIADLSTLTVRAMAFRRTDGSLTVIYWSPTMSGRSEKLRVGDCILNATETVQTFNLK